MDSRDQMKSFQKSINFLSVQALWAILRISGTVRFHKNAPQCKIASWLKTTGRLWVPQCARTKQYTLHSSAKWWIKLWHHLYACLVCRICFENISQQFIIYLKVQICILNMFGSCSYWVVGEKFKELCYRAAESFIQFSFEYSMMIVSLSVSTNTKTNKKVIL